MKRTLPANLLVGLALGLSLFSCRKSISSDTDKDSANYDPSTYANNRPTIAVDTTREMPKVPFPQSVSTVCNYVPNYGDTILYPQPGGADYIVSPFNTPPAGKFYSWPAGMTIDSLTGAINVTRSETGVRYAIGFVKAGTSDTCMTQLIIGGAAYLDSIYIIEQGQNAAKPYFNANTLLQSVCGGNGCTFDVNNTAANSNVILDRLTGIIDLQKTLNGTGLLGVGVFGLLPLNGQSVTVPVYYRVNDASNNALQHINLQFVYYYSKSQMQTGLILSILNKLTNAQNNAMVSTMANPRPPLIVIVRRP